MKKLFIPVFSLISLTGAAVAADLPSHKAPTLAPEPTPMWTGFYAGLNVGGGFGYAPVSSSGVPYDPWGVANDATHSSNSIFDRASLPWETTFNAISFANNFNKGFSQSGVIGGIQLGYNYQVSNSFVLGFEADFQGSSISGNTGSLGAGIDGLTNHVGRNLFGYAADPVIQTRETSLFTSVSSSIDWFGTARGRVGYLLMPNLLAYATGGFTYAGVTNKVSSYGISSYSGWTSPLNQTVIYKGSAPAFGGNSSSSISIGWNVGGGFEYMISQNWSLKTEAIYYNLGGINTSSAVISGGIPRRDSIAYPGWGSANNTNVSYNGVIARAGVNYHFNMANAVPVVAKF